MLINSELHRKELLYFKLNFFLCEVKYLLPTTRPLRDQKFNSGHLAGKNGQKKNPALPGITKDAVNLGHWRDTEF